MPTPSLLIESSFYLFRRDDGQIVPVLVTSGLGTKVPITVYDWFCWREVLPADANSTPAKGKSPSIRLGAESTGYAEPLDRWTRCTAEEAVTLANDRAATEF